MAKWITAFTKKIEDWASRTEFIYKLAESYYHDVIKKEIVLANISKEDHILCIGGGICPFSAILLHQASGAKVTVIDNDSRCVAKASQLVERLGLSGKVKVSFKDGCSTNLTFSKYSIVHFALQVNPMACVFSHVEEHVAPGTKLLVRRPKRQLRRLYSRLPSPMLNLCPLIIHSKTRNIGSTLLYVKQEAANEHEREVAQAVGTSSESAA